MKKFLKKLAYYSLGIYLINLLLGFGLKALGPKYSDASYGQIKWDDFRSLPPNSLDVIFLGSSHFLSAIDPEIVDSLSGLNSYNMARVGLRPASAYVLLHEVLQEQKPKYLVLDIFHRTFLSSGYNHLYDFGYANYEGGKTSFAINNFSLHEISRLFYPSYLYRSNFPKLRPLLGLRSKKENWEDLHYKGYIQHPETVSLDKLQQNEFTNFHFDPSGIRPESLRYLDKLVALCHDLDIEMIWVTTPIPDLCIEGIQNQKDIDSYFSRLAVNYQVPYINYNSKSWRERLSLSDLTDYSDDDHVNVSGAEKISTDLAIIIGEKSMLANNDKEY